jgi:hypothetical protein
MTFLVLVPLALAFAWLCRLGVRRDLRAAEDRAADDLRPPVRPVIAEVVPVKVDDPRSTWTALDDIQLNRLLKDSSPER